MDDSMRMYSALVDSGNAQVASVVNVWSNGRVIRRYQGQGEGFTRSPERGYRKMVAILIEVGDVNE